MNTKKNSVRVRILGEEYTVRTDASPDRTRAIAQYFDRAVRQVLAGGHVAETHRAAILAGLQITGDLFEARDAAEELTAGLRSLTQEVGQVVEAEALHPAEVDTTN
ncbi:MAG: cell division protein ZapA [Gemmatimonadaceae bacterium]